MNKLISELQRLYFLPGQQWHSQQLDDSGKPACSVEGTLTTAIVASSLEGKQTIALQLVSADGMARAMVMSFKKPDDWDKVANLYQALQDELDLPAPAISISGRKGYRLWFSLAEPVPVALTRGFLDALRRKYLAEITAVNFQLQPATGQAICKLAPALHAATGKWSAFIDPSMGAMFIAEPGLEMAPNMGRQADLLAGLKSIKAGDLQRALNVLQRPAEPAGSPDLPPAQGAARVPDTASGPPPARLNVGKDYSDPKSFLLAVMNDASASARQRIRAAKALLPYFCAPS
jgi:hypothetical protein